MATAAAKVEIKCFIQQTFADTPTAQKPTAHT